MTDERAHERRYDGACAEHNEAPARNEKRLLRVTDTGDLHSYRAAVDLAAD